MAYQRVVTRVTRWVSPTVFSEVRVARSSVFYVMFCRSLFVLLSFFAIALSVLRFTAGDYHFGIFQLYFLQFLYEFRI